ncbi:MAG: hydroxyisourate hydrolase [Acidobacteriota bacterium]
MKSPITTHILDTARGAPAAGVDVTLFGAAGELGRGTTDADGRVGDLLAPGTLEAGVYRLHFAVAAYLESRGESGFYPGVDVHFRVDDPGQHYHVPLLLSPFGYSTYRGS